MLPKSDYYAFERLAHNPSDLSSAGPWDFFLSAYDKTERVQQPFDSVQASWKQWVVYEEYQLPKGEWPTGAVELHPSFDPQLSCHY